MYICITMWPKNRIRMRYLSEEQRGFRGKLLYLKIHLKAQDLLFYVFLSFPVRLHLFKHPSREHQFRLSLSRNANERNTQYAHKLQAKHITERKLLKWDRKTQWTDINEWLSISPPPNSKMYISTVCQWHKHEMNAFAGCWWCRVDVCVRTSN